MPIILAVLAFAIIPAFGQQVPEFVTVIPPADEPAASGSASIVQNTATVNIDLDSLEAPKMRLTVLGATLEITHKETITRGPGDFTYIGSTPGEESNVFIAVLGNQSRLEIDRLGTNYVMAPNAEDTHTIKAYNPLAFGSGNEKTNRVVLNPNYQNIIRNLPDRDFSRQTYHDLPVDLLVVHTTAAQSAAGAMVFGEPSHIRLITTLAVDKANSAFRYNDIPIDLNIVRTTSDSRYRESGNLQTDLDRLITKGDGHFEPGLALIEREEADIGILIVNNPSSSVCGLASSLLPDPEDASVAINIGCNLSTNTDLDLQQRENNSDLSFIIAHEIGHVFGARHERSNDPATAPFAYGHGHRTNDRHDSTKCHATIMAYPADCIWDRTWSDPGKYFTASRTPAGTAAHEDNARVLERTAPYVASLRGVSLEHTLKTNVNPIIEAPDDVIMQATRVLTRVDIDRDDAKVFDWNDSRVRASHNAPSAFPVGTTTVTWTVTNSLGRTATDTQTVTIVDTVDPVFRDSPRDVFASGVSGATVTYDAPRARDIFTVTVTCTPESGSRFLVGSTPVTCTAEDANGNTAQASFRVHVSRITDSQAPSVTAPEDKTFEATAVRTPLSSSQIGTATATDTVDSSPRITNNAPAAYPLGTTTVTWTATDESGNSATDSQTITIRDTTPPSFGATPPDVTAETLATTATVRYNAPAASDIFPVTVSCTPVSGSIFQFGTTTVSCTARDDNANTATTSFSVMVTTDTTPPTITPPPDVTAEATAVRTPVSIGTATATDHVTASPLITSDAPADYPIGATTVTWTATDDAANTATATQMITVRDTTPPVLAQPDDITVSVNGTSASVSFDVPASSDIFASTSQCDHASGSAFMLGATTVTCTARDASGNTATATFTVTVVSTIPDTTAPVIVQPPDRTIEATGERTPVRLTPPAATDDTTASPTVTSNAPADYPLGTTTVTWTATDEAGNSVTAVQRITVRDTTAPVFSSTPPDVTITTSASEAAVRYAAPAATDIFPVTVSCSPTSRSVFQVGETTVTCTATDSSRNTATTTFTVTVAPDPATLFSVYVADLDDREVQVHSQTGAYLGSIVSRGSANIDDPWDVVFGPDGNLYVSDNRNSEILKYDGTTGDPISATYQRRSADWVTTLGDPRGLVWRDNVLYAATDRGIERFSLAGASLGIFGDASRSPSGSAPSIGVAYDVAFCPGGRMYVADYPMAAIRYYSASTGSYQGTISSYETGFNTSRPTGLHCGDAIAGTGTSLYQSGDFRRGVVNELNQSTGAHIRSHTSNLDEPAGMDMDGLGNLYVANSDGDHVTKFDSSGSASVFVRGMLDEPYGVAMGPVYNPSATGAADQAPAPVSQNDGPKLAHAKIGDAGVDGPITLSPPATAVLTVSATDADGDAVEIGIDQDSMPPGSISISDAGDGTATVSIDSSGIKAGTYVFWITASDNKGDIDREPYAVIVTSTQ